MAGLKNSGSGLGTFFSGIIRKWILKDLSTRLIGLRVGEDVPRKSSIIMTFELHNYVPLFIRRNLRIRGIHILEVTKLVIMGQLVPEFLGSNSVSFYKHIKDCKHIKHCGMVYYENRQLTVILTISSLKDLISYLLFTNQNLF